MVFLTQTDTTIGFVSQNAHRLSQIKQRPATKHYIRAVDSLATLKSFVRTPQAHKKLLRRANKTTFIMPHKDAYRVVKDPHHLLLLKRLKWAYTTSANLSGKSYDENFAKEAADVMIEPLKTDSKPSTILKLGKRGYKRIR